LEILQTHACDLGAHPLQHERPRLGHDAAKIHHLLDATAFYDAVFDMLLKEPQSALNTTVWLISYV
jgi:hypothetical protein